MHRIDSSFQEKAELLGQLIGGRLAYHQTMDIAHTNRLLHFTQLHTVRKTLTDPTSAQEVYIPGIMIRTKQIKIEDLKAKMVNVPTCLKLTGNNWYNFLYKFARQPCYDHERADYKEGVEEEFSPAISVYKFINPIERSDDYPIIDNLIETIWAKERREFVRKMYRNRFSKALMDRLDDTYDEVVRA